MIKRRLIIVLMISIAVSLALTACGTESEVALGVGTPPSVQTEGIADQEVDSVAVDLSMDLAVLATLTTDAGQTVQAIRWDGPSGGHHITGLLSFPVSVDSIPILDGARKLTLTLKDVDAPERKFVWDR
jgi:hypothetical protein